MTHFSESFPLVDLLQKVETVFQLMMLSARTTPTAPPKSRLLFNADSLKDLLNVRKAEDKKKKEGGDAARKRKKLREFNQEIFQSILKAETGSIAPPIIKRYVCK